MLERLRRLFAPRESRQPITIVLDENEGEIVAWMQDTWQFPKGVNWWWSSGSHQSGIRYLTVPTPEDERIWTKILKGYNAGKMPHVEVVNVESEKYTIVDFDAM